MLEKKFDSEAGIEIFLKGQKLDFLLKDLKGQKLDFLLKDLQ